MAADATREFLQSLPEIRAGETFWFSCHPGVPCFNACCSDLTMPLTPYDVLRLQQGLGMNSDDFFEEFTTIGCYPDTGFPLLHLRMADGPGKPCPFLTQGGCGVYEHRSSACRTYPLGRATRPGNPDDAASPLLEQFFLVREDHCKGFVEQKPWITATWLEDQGLVPYMCMNDRYMRLVARYKSVAGKAVLSGKHATMALLCLYQMDRFADFTSSTSLMQRIRFQGEWAALPEADLVARILGDPETRLSFGMEWMELVLFGSAPLIAPA